MEPEGIKEESEPVNMSGELSRAAHAVLPMPTYTYAMSMGSGASRSLESECGEGISPCPGNIDSILDGMLVTRPRQERHYSRGDMGLAEQEPALMIPRDGGTEDRGVERNEGGHTHSPNSLGAVYGMGGMKLTERMETIPYTISIPAQVLSCRRQAAIKRSQVAKSRLENTLEHTRSRLAALPLNGVSQEVHALEMRT